jgi:hypothetical protein
VFIPSTEEAIKRDSAMIEQLRVLRDQPYHRNTFLQLELLGFGPA